MTGYTWHYGTLRDGNITGTIPVVSSSWSDVMDDAGPLQLVMTLADPDVAAIDPYNNAEPCRCFLAVSYTDPQGTETFLAGGPIWTHSWDPDTLQLTVGASGLWSYYDHRKLLPVLTAGQSAATVTSEYTAVLGTIAKRLVQQAHTFTAGAVPVVFQADEAGTDTRVYNGFDLTVVGQALRDLTTVENGPEIQFVPRRRADDGRYIEWLMRVGTASAPLLTQVGADWVWDATVERPSVTLGPVTRDGASMGSRVWMKGAGSDSGTLIVEADDTTLTDAGFPLLEIDGSGQEQETDPTVVSAAAQGLLASSQRPPLTLTVKVRRDTPPTVGEFAVGDWVSLTVKPGPYLPGGTYRTRITGRSGDDSLDVSLQLAPIPGGG